MDSIGVLDQQRPRASAKPDWAMSGREVESATRVAAGLPPLRRRWPWVVAGIILLGGAGYGYTLTREPAADAVAEEPVTTVVTRMQVNLDEFITIGAQTLNRTIKVIGTLEPSRTAELSSQTGGLVEAVNARPGDRVTAGDVLVQVDVERLTLELDLTRSNADATRAQLALAEGQLERAEALVARGVATATTLEEAQSSVEGLRASLSAQTDQIAAAELTQRNATVTAPFDGIVSQRNAEPGIYVQVGVPLIAVVDIATVEMQANAAVSAGSLLVAGQDVSVVVDGIAARMFPGTVARINPVAAVDTRTIPVYVTIENPDGVLLGGMFATGQIVVAEAVDAFAVPTDALREDQDGLHVLKIVDGTLVRQAVTGGDEWQGGLTQITDGLVAGDNVIAVPLPELVAGDLVDLTDSAVAPAADAALSAADADEPAPDTAPVAGK